MSKVKKVAALSIGQGINVVVNFLFLPYMARVLSYEDYGSYGQVLLIISFIAALLTFGLDQIIYVYLNKSSQSNSVFSANLVAGLLLGTFGVLLISASSSFFSNWLNNPALADLLKLYSLSLLFIIPIKSITSFFIFNNRVKDSVVLAVGSNLLKILLVVSAIQLYKSVFLALLAILLSNAVHLLSGLYLNRKKISFHFPLDLLKNQLKYGFPLGLTGVVGTAILYIDGIMVSKLEGVNAYAIYRNGALEVPYIATLYSSIAAIILPEVAKLFSKEKFSEIVQLKKKVITNTMMITYPILIFLLFNSKELIVLYLGEKYEASAIIFAVFNLTLLMRVNSYTDILIAANKSKLILYYNLLVFSVNAILNYILIQQLGIIGAAISTVISLFLFAILLFRVSAKKIQANWKSFFETKKIAQLFVFSLSVAFLINACRPFVEDPFWFLIVFATVYFSVVYFLIYKRGLISPEIVNMVKRNILRKK